MTALLSQSFASFIFAAAEHWFRCRDSDDGTTAFFF